MSRPNAKRRRDIQEILDSLGGTDPIEFLGRTIDDASVDRGLRQDAAKSLLPYLYPKLQTVTLQGDNEGGPIQIDHAVRERILNDPELSRAAEDLALAVEAESGSDGGKA